MRKRNIGAFLLTAALVTTSIPPAFIMAEPTEITNVTESEAVEEQPEETTGSTSENTAFPDFPLNAWSPDIEVRNPEIVPSELPTGAELPERFDLRDVNGVSYITDVKDQGGYGTCWTFSAAGAIESGMLHRNQASRNSLDLSEIGIGYLGENQIYNSEDMFSSVITSAGRKIASKNLTAVENARGNIVNSVSMTDIPYIGYMNHSGNDYLTIRGLSSGKAVLDEASVPYPSGDSGSNHEGAISVTKKAADFFDGDSSEGITSVARLQDADILSMDNPELLKAKLMTDGAASVLFEVDMDCFDGTYTNYCNLDKNFVSGGHFVLISGWDDTYSRDNFTGRDKPQNDGAWLIKNSWGESVGDNGYFYISYDDATIKNMGSPCFYHVVTESENQIDHTYLHDGAFMNDYVIKSDKACQAEIYSVPENAGMDQTVKQIGLYMTSDINYTAEVYKNPTVDEDGIVENPKSGTLIGKTEGTNTYFGYHEIPVTCTENLKPGDTFSIVVTHIPAGSNKSVTLMTESDFYNWGETANKVGYDDVTSHLDGEYYGKMTARANVSRGQGMISEDGETFQDSLDFAAKKKANGISLGNNILHAGTADVTGLSVSEDTISMNQGQIGGQTVTVQGQDVGKLLYSSDNTEIAAVDEAGRVTALKPGSAIITACAESDSKIAITYEVQVYGSLGNCTVEDIPEQQYTGEEIIPVITIKNGTEELEENEDYTLAFSNNKEVGTAKVTVSGNGFYQGMLEKTFAIKEIPFEVLLTEGEYYTYSGKPVIPEVTVIKDGKELTDTEYKVTGRNNINAGTARIMVTDLKDGYTATKTFHIMPASIYSVSIDSIPDQEWTGKEITPELTLSYNGILLNEDKDYTAEYQNNVDVRTAYGLYRDPVAVVKATGNFEGERSIHFTICKPRTEGTVELSKAKIENVQAMTYTGQEIMQQPAVTLGKDKLEEGSDYYITYTDSEGGNDHTNTGKVTMTIHGIGTYKGTASKAFAIKAASLNSTSLNVELASYSYPYTGEKIMPDVNVYFKNGAPVFWDEYDVKVSNNKNAGKATVTVKAKSVKKGGSGNITGSKKLTFYITKGNIALEPLTLSENYTGKAIKPEIKELKGTDGKTYEIGTDYKLSFQQNVNAGQAVVILTGKGAHKAEKGYTTFTINPVNPENLKCTVNTVTLFGKVLYLNVNVKNGKKKLKRNTDYKMFYELDTTNKCGTITLNFMGNYDGERELIFSL